MFEFVCVVLMETCHPCKITGVLHCLVVSALNLHGCDWVVENLAPVFIVQNTSQEAFYHNFELSIPLQCFALNEFIFYIFASMV